MALFQQSVLSKYIQSFDKKVLDTKWNDFTAIFHNLEKQNNIRNSKEEQYQEGFLRDLFVQILGYTINPETNFNLLTEQKNITNSKKADGAILAQGSNGFQSVVAVIELKGTDTTDLAKIETQAFGYKNNQPECVYVITSNFEKLRFYIENAVDFIEFNLFKLTKQEFELLYVCLSYENIKGNIPKQLKDESVSNENKITKQLYKDYSEFKRALFNNLVERNPQIDKLLLFKKTQKLLDRFLFIFFAEDRHLVPTNLIRRINLEWENLQKMRIPVSLYERYKMYFEDLNSGAKVTLPAFGKKTGDAITAEFEIFAYNGGLFAPDEILDNVQIDDEILHKHSIILSDYDFDSDVDVNILGHIFENSLNEIDEIKSELEGKEIDKTKTKRKKDGVFYTPKYITKYIVDNTVGKLCQEKKSELGIIDEEFAKGRKNRNKSTIEKLDNLLHQYRDWLLQITICDPACGSGAFLNQALEFLIQEHQYIDNLEAQLLGSSLGFPGAELHILEKNIYGVDLNDESVEIAKLSLWLRTAQKGRKLNSLNNNIKCGNSLIDDPEVAGEKAFSWEKEFPEVFVRGGFDVIIGNPPYVTITSNSYFEKNYSTTSCGDLYSLFYEKSTNLLIETGYLGFITPSSFLTNIRFQSLRLFFLKYKINTILDLGENVFADASVDSAIIIIEKNQVENNIINCSGSNFNFFKIEKKTFESYNLNIFNIYANPNAFKLTNKIKNRSKTMDDFLTFSRGVEFGFSSDKVFDKMVSQNHKPILCGGNISKNNFYFENKFILHDETNLGIYKNKEIYEKEKVLIKRIGNSIIGCYDDKGYYNVCDVYNLQLKPQIDIPLKVISIILNSRFISFYYDTNFKSVKKLFPKIPIQNLKLLPIPEVKKIKNELLIEKSDFILSLNKDLQQTQQKFSTYFSSQYQIEKLSGKLEKWYELSFVDFIKELNKAIKTAKGTPLTKKDEFEWMELFEDNKKKALALKAEIDKTDKEIDQMVYALYGLTEEEIKIVENV